MPYDPYHVGKAPISRSPAWFTRPCRVTFAEAPLVYGDRRKAACDAHRIRGAVAWRVAADGYWHVRADEFAPGVEPVKGFAIFRHLRRLWIPLIILVVISAGGFAVWRLHGIFGSQKRPSYADTKINDTKHFDSKQLTYEVFGAPGTVANISYFDVDGDPQLVKGVSLPWSLKFAITQAAVAGSVVAQGDSETIGCRIVVDGEVKAERISNEVNAFTFCQLKAA